VSQKLSHEAVEWFVLNESRTAEDAELAQRWKQWCVEPGNRAEYVSLLQLAQDLHELAAPSEASRKELLRDVAAGESGVSRAG
jgi:ferric-dicitrate binding protein FerR (iron transport regulator)